MLGATRKTNLHLELSFFVGLIAFVLFPASRFSVRRSREMGNGPDVVLRGDNRGNGVR